MPTSTTSEQKTALKRLVAESSLSETALKMLVTKASLQRLKPITLSHHACRESSIPKSSMHPLIPKVALFKPPQRVRTGPPVSKSSVGVVRAGFKSIAAGAAPCSDRIFPELQNQLMVIDRSSHCQMCGRKLYKSFSACKSCLPPCPPAPTRIGIDCPP